MPTYVFSTAKEMTTDQRMKIAESVTAIHHVEARAPRFFVQVLFNKVKPGSMILGGAVAPNDHIWVRADIRAGRTREQKARILNRIMQETSGILNILPENVWVYISDIPAEAIAELGSILPEPGHEDEWLAALPAAMRDKLTAAS